MRSNPRSGRLSRGSVSYLGPPTAPSNTASAYCANNKHTTDNGTPTATKPTPPMGACSASNLKPKSRKTSSTFIASATISGPMPSPANTAILFVMSVVPIKFRWVVLRSGKQPRRLDAATLFIRLDLVGVLQGETDVVEAVEQFVFAELVNVELECFTARCV